ncbi:NAD-dependent epimerase/dehydratase family protein [Luteimonas aquatica]|uniref:NAD-dependent epimerase/dehydratase family protein n=1 Tax=Luteimonas aquatica TaxID=450364 RepID=UPI001F55F347|nr:NAD-dependent epimerase/dehydratase family protein [Luteimonas aquatica]
MNVLIFGATGMVGQGVLRECLRAKDVARVVTVGRNATGQRHPKLEEIVHADMHDYTAIESRLGAFDACFFCLGVSSVGMNEADYTRVTHDLTLAAAQALARLNPRMTFVYVTGAGTDSSEQGRSMWARVKGRTENALRRLPFAAVYLFRPGAIQPLHGIRSKTALYQAAYTLARPLFSVLRALFPDAVVTTESIGLAMLAVAREGAAQPILESRDIRLLAERESSRG